MAGSYPFGFTGNVGSGSRGPKHEIPLSSEIARRSENEGLKKDVHQRGPKGHVDTRILEVMISGTPFSLGQKFQQAGCLSVR